MSDPRRRRPVPAAPLVAAALLAALPGTVLAAQGPILAPAPTRGAAAAESRKLMRDITVMEKVIDQMLLDSRNLLVYSHENNTRGLYLEEFGILFSFQASLVDRELTGSWEDLENLKFEIKEDGDNLVIVRTPDGKKPGDTRPVSTQKGTPAPEAPDPPAPPSGTPKTPRAPKPVKVPRILNWQGERDPEAEAKLYAGGKAEIIQTLLDYGDTMNSLKDTQWLAIAAFLRNNDYFIDNRIARLLVKARMSDLRAYAAGRLSEEQMKERVVTEEY